MDSRIVLGAVSSETKLTCLTYGKKDDYDVKDAKKLAKKRNYEFRSFSDYNLYFPTRKVLKKYIKESETLRITSWLEILENIEEHNNSYLLFGDVCEVFPARNIKAFSSRKTRINSFFKQHILKKYPTFTEASKNEFNKWKISKITEVVNFYSKEKIEKLEIQIEMLKEKILMPDIDVSDKTKLAKEIKVSTETLQKMKK